jgi:predicted nucleic acid-binding protein
VNRLAAVAEIVETPAVDRVVPDDPDDDFVVHTAIAGRADVLCTRDSHPFDRRIAEHCARRGIRMMDDIELYSVLTGKPHNFLATDEHG